MLFCVAKISVNQLKPYTTLARHVIFKYVATRTDPLVNTLVDIMHELLCIRRQIAFVFDIFIRTTLTYATLMTLLIVLRGRYTFNCLFWFYSVFNIILCFGTIS
jgi:hypothetical protein